jgi:hypothetical protein
MSCGYVPDPRAVGGMALEAVQARRAPQHRVHPGLSCTGNDGWPASTARRRLIDADTAAVAEAALQTVALR